MPAGRFSKNRPPVSSRLFLHANAEGSAFFLKREGEEGRMEFISLDTAINYARSCRGVTGKAVVLYDENGRECRQIPLDAALNGGEA